MPGIGVILNPHSRSNRKNPERRKRLGFIVGDKGSCHETQTLADVERLAREFHDRRIEILGISGGDGTLHATLSTFAHVYGETPLPHIAFLRGGTINNVAGTIGVLGTPEKILSQIILKYHRSEPFRTTQLNLLNVNGRYGFVFGMGVVVRFLESYGEKGEHYQTPWRAMKILTGYVLSSFVNGKSAAKLCQRFDAKITADGKELPFKNYNMIFGGTIESLTFGFRPMYRARQLTDQFQFVGISTPPRHLLSLFPRALAGKPQHSDCVLDLVARSMVIELPEPMLYSMDGDFPEGPTSRIELGLGPRITCILS